MKYPQNQNGKNRPQFKEWQDIRAELMQLKNQFNLSDDEFRPLSPTKDFKGIEEKIYQTFCKIKPFNQRSNLLWLSFKQTEFWTENLPDNPENYLHEMIDLNEKIWFVMHDFSVSKMWFYEGKIQAIQKLIGETHHYEEMYFISKKFKWLFCVTHHDMLITTGEKMPEKLENLVKKLKPNYPNISHKAFDTL